MPPLQLSVLSLLALLAFSGNSLLGRLALKETPIDPASFTSIRLLSGAIVLWILVSCFNKTHSEKNQKNGSWVSALALFSYAAAFSFAYVSLDAGIGALILFGAVQATMISFGLWHGEKLSLIQWIGFSSAIGGLILLLFPGVSTPSIAHSILMITAGISWGIYSIRGKNTLNPTTATERNFLLTLPLTLLLSLVTIKKINVEITGVIYAALSGGLTSAIGYSIWYKVLPHLRSTTAATMQLSAPVITSIAGILFLNELFTWQLVLASIVILGGIGLVIFGKTKGI